MSEETPANTLVATNGSSVAIVRETHADGSPRERIEVRDASARVVFELDTTSNRARITIPQGDLSVEAPNGNIAFAAGGNISMSASGDVAIGSKGEVAIASKSLAVHASRAEVRVRELAYAGLRLASKITDVALSAERIETAAERIFERAKNVFRSVEDLSQLKAGRSRAIVDNAYVVRSGNTSISSREETKIDGSEILLG